jgi:hypothetical protein
VVSALGFAMAYYFDIENGEVRRKQLRQMAQRAFHTLHDGLAADVEDAAPVFPSVLRSHDPGGLTRHPGGRTAAAR